MGGRDPAPLRSLPRCFVDGVEDPAPSSIPLPADELHKLRHVLRLGSGDELAVLPGDGRLFRCVLEGNVAKVGQVARPESEPARKVRLAVALSKPDALESAVRMATEIGVSSFVVFPAARSVVRWQPGKEQEKLDRLRRIVREAAEVAFRMILPTVEWAERLESVLEGEWWALSESEDAAPDWPEIGPTPTLLLGPEGGWAPHEAAILAERSLSLGPRVLRVATAAAVGSAAVLGAPGPYTCQP